MEVGGGRDTDWRLDGAVGGGGEESGDGEEMADALQFLSGERDMLDSEDGEHDVEGQEQRLDQSEPPPPQDQQQPPSTASTSHFYTFLADKAGMQEGVLSKEEVARIVHEASCNSRYYKHQQRQDEVGDPPCVSVCVCVCLFVSVSVYVCLCMCAYVLRVLQCR